MSSTATPSESPWRRIFEEVRSALNNRRDSSGIVGSINWLRKHMEARGANPNVVRNIIYRDKGKLADKRVLFTLLSELWESTGRPPLRVPELEMLLTGSGEGEGEIVQLLGREKRRAYQSFVGAVRSGEHPKLLITGKPGSGKTLLSDYIQQALELPNPGAQLVRQEFSGQNLAATLTQLASKLGLAPEAFEAKLIKVGVSGAYSVQADAQADVARVLLAQLRGRQPLTLLLHVSQSLPGHDMLSGAPLRLSTPDVPRVGLTEWLWHNLFEPIGRLPEVSVLLSMAELPLTLAERTAAFEGPIKLSPPSTNEARRFVRARAQHLSAEQQEALVQRSKRSFEDLRTLTLLAEARELPGDSSKQGDSSRHLEQLGQLVVSSSDPELKTFLEAVAVLSLGEFPSFTQEALAALRQTDNAPLSTLEAAFLDAVPGQPQSPSWRPFSRQLSRALRGHLKETDPERFRTLSLAASRIYQEGAHSGDRADSAARYVHHLFAARAWDELIAWAQRSAVPQTLLQRLWQAAREELSDRRTVEAIALQVAAYYARLGSTEHPDAVQAFALLSASEDPSLRAWTLLKRAEGAVLHGHFEEAETLLALWDRVGDPLLNLEATLIRANLARWYSRLDEAARLIGEATAALAELREPTHSLAVRVRLWAGLIAKDRGELEEALAHFRSIAGGDDLLKARVAFQQGDVLFKLGHFAEAGAAFTSAVEHAYRGEAPLFERARYLSRRGLLRVQQGALEAAESDIGAAHSTLEQAESEHATFRIDFERAKAQDEAVCLMLAAGQTDSAIAALQANLETFSAYGERHGVDPSFRILRGTLRLAYAYSCRALSGSAQLPLVPYPESAALHPDLQQARALMGRLLAELGRAPGRYAALQSGAHLRASLLLPPQEAVTEAQAALALARYPYQRAQAQLHLAGALLRSGDAAGAHELLGAAQPDLSAAATDDYALFAYAAGLEAEAKLRLGAPAEAHARLARALLEAALAPYAEALLQRFGEAAERLGQPLEPAALGLGDAPLPSTLRPADALVLRWRQQVGKPAETREPVPATAPLESV